MDDDEPCRELVRSMLILRERDSRLLPLPLLLLLLLLPLLLPPREYDVDVPSLSYPSLLLLSPPRCNNRRLLGFTTLTPGRCLLNTPPQSPPPPLPPPLTIGRVPHL